MKKRWKKCYKNLTRMKMNTGRRRERAASPNILTMSLTSFIGAKSKTSTTASRNCNHFLSRRQVKSIMRERWRWLICWPNNKKLIPWIS